MVISTTIKSIQDIMRQDAGVDGDAQRISQLVWLIFLKLFDAAEDLYEWEEAYISPIPEPLRWRTWAADDEGITGDDLMAFIDNQLFPTLYDKTYPEAALTNINELKQTILQLCDNLAAQIRHSQTTRTALRDAILR